MTASLKEIVRRRLGRIGYVYTLSDKNYKQSELFAFFTSVWNFSEYVVGPIFRPSITFYRAISLRDIGLLAMRIKRSRGANWRTAVSGNQALNIRTSDNCWKECVASLLNSCDIIVMDISKVGIGSAWEIEALFFSNQLPRCVFLAQESHAATAEAALAGRSVRAPIHFFQSTAQFNDDAGFQRAIIAALELSWALNADYAEKI